MFYSKVIEITTVDFYVKELRSNQVLKVSKLLQCVSYIEYAESKFIMTKEEGRLKTRSTFPSSSQH